MTVGHQNLLGSLSSDQPPGSVFVFLDESFDPLVAASAVVVEASEVQRLDAEIVEIYEKLRGSYQLQGLDSFEEFRIKGFHATSDPPEIQMAFVGFLAEVLSFKSMVVFSDRSKRPEVSDKQRLMVVFQHLVRDVLRSYTNRPKVVLLFESAQGMDRYVERVVDRVVHSLGRRAPDVEVRFGSKRDPDLLAVPDYVLHTFNRWYMAKREGPAGLNPADHKSRSFRAILGSISMARSLDNSTVIRRTF